MKKEPLMLALEYGRPQDAEDRLPKEKRCYDFLDKLGVEYARVDHAVTDTMQACAEIDGILGAPTCKNLFLTNRQCTAFYILLIPADKIFKTKDLSAQIGSSRLSFGSGEYMERLLDITPGSLSILGLMNDLDRDVTLLIDEDVMASEFVGMHPCINTTTLRIKTAELRDKVIPALGHRPTYVKLPVYSAEQM